MRDSARRCFVMGKTLGMPLAQPETDAARGEAFAGIADRIVIQGETYRLVFDNMTFVLIEQIYRERYGRVVGLPQVIEELGVVSYAAVMAVFYAAMKRAAMLDGDAGRIPEWDAYVQTFQLASIPDVAEKLRSMTDRAIIPAEPDEKNGATPQTASPKTAGRGRG
ncbi:MAG: hypothetical protein VB104_07930 [Candidatus Limiplasma sp.]|nr:hypothetical protein [Candidatus Limiplasma sp.]